MVKVLCTYRWWNLESSFSHMVGFLDSWSMVWVIVSAARILNLTFHHARALCTLTLVLTIHSVHTFAQNVITHPGKHLVYSWYVLQCFHRRIDLLIRCFLSGQRACAHFILLKDVQFANIMYRLRRSWFLW